MGAAFTSFAITRSYRTLPGPRKDLSLLLQSAGGHSLVRTGVVLVSSLLLIPGM